MYYESEKKENCDFKLSQSQNVELFHSNGWLLLDTNIR